MLVDTLERLRARLAELSDLGALDMLAGWDQMVMMPSEGGGARASQVGTLSRLAHELARAAEIGAWLEELDDAQLAGRDGDMVRLARRDWERARLVPAELAAERSAASSAGQEVWRHARAAVGVAELPLGGPVEVEVVAEVDAED